MRQTARDCRIRACRGGASGPIRMRGHPAQYPTEHRESAPARHPYAGEADQSAVARLDWWPDVFNQIETLADPRQSPDLREPRGGCGRLFLNQCAFTINRERFSTVSRNARGAIRICALFRLIGNRRFPYAAETYRVPPTKAAGQELMSGPGKALLSKSASRNLLFRRSHSRYCSINLETDPSHE
jgi:hypothetical protein